jgi:hypothetical protein
MNTWTCSVSRDDKRAAPLRLEPIGTECEALCCGRAGCEGEPGLHLRTGARAEKAKRRHARTMIRFGTIAFDIAQ